MSKKQKKPNYKLRSKMYKGAGLTTIGITTIGGFVAYESMIDWGNFKQELDNFMVVQQESVKLNLALAMPALIGLLVFLVVAMKKNKDFFKDKISISLLITILIFYLVYSIIEVTLASLIGAFVGSVIDEFGFSIASKSNKIKAEEAHDIDNEYEREMRRIQARQKAKEDFLNDGSV